MKLSKYTIVIMAAVVLVLLVGGGVAYVSLHTSAADKSTTTPPPSARMKPNSDQQGCSQTSNAGCSGSQGDAHPPVIGTISAVSSNSITVNISGGGIKTFSVL